MPLNVISLTQLLTKPFSSKYQEIQNDCRPFTITLLQNCGCCITNCFYHYRKERFGNSCAGFVNNNHINNELLWQTKMNVLPHQTLFLFWTLLYFPKITLWKYVITAFQHCHHYLSIKPTQELETVLYVRYIYIYIHWMQGSSMTKLSLLTLFCLIKTELEVTRWGVCHVHNSTIFFFKMVDIDT